MTLDTEVRRDEAWLSVHPGDAADIAVGLDDLKEVPAIAASQKYFGDGTKIAAFSH